MYKKKIYHFPGHLSQKNIALSNKKKTDSWVLMSRHTHHHYAHRRLVETQRFHANYVIPSYK